MSGKYIEGLKIIFTRSNRSILRSALSLGISSVITQIIMMIYLVIIAGWLDADKYSFIAAVYAVASMTSFFFNWGLNEWMMKLGSTSESPEHLGGSVIFFKIVVGIFWGIGLFIFLRNLNPKLYLTDILIITLLDVWLDSLFGTLLVILVLKIRSELASVLLVSSRIIRLLGGLILITVGIKSIFIVSITRLICTLLIFLIAWFFTRPILGSKGKLTPHQIFRDSSAFNISEIFNLIFLHTEINLLAFMGSDLVLISNYSIVIGLINALMLFPLSVYTVLIGSLVRTYDLNVSRFNRHILIVYSGFTIVGLILWVGVVYIGSPAITLLLGNSYQMSGIILVMLSPILFIRTLNQANVTYLVTVGWQAKRLIPQMSVVLLKILIGIWAMLQWHFVGLVIVAITADVILLFGYFYQVFQHYSSNRRLIFQ